MYLAMYRVIEKVTQHIDAYNAGIPIKGGTVKQ